MSSEPGQPIVPKAAGHDGAAFYQGDNLHVTFYDQLYGTNAQQYGDIAWYDVMAEQTGSRILDAGCGSGRVLLGLVRAGRDLTGIDASAELLQQAHRKAIALARPEYRIVLSPQRMENFRFERQFDLILCSYYSFSNLLYAEQRHACLKQIAEHLAPNGRVVLHLPAAELLSREVSATEIASMRAEHKINTGIGPSMVLLQFVTAMHYDPTLKRRSMDLHAVLSDSEGNVLKHDPRRVFYACISAEELAQEAASAGLAVINTDTGFKQQTATELLVVLTHAGR